MNPAKGKPVSLKPLSLKGEEANLLLRRLLGNLAGVAGEMPLLIARALFIQADTAEELEKRLFYEQIFTSLMRSLENFAMLCLMGWDESRHLLDIYTHLERPELRAFYARVRKGLSEEAVFKLTCAASWEHLKKMPAFKGKDFSSDEDALDWQAREAEENLNRFAAIYSAGPEAADPVLGPWQLAWTKMPLGQKLLQDPESLEAELLAGVEQADPTKPGSATIFTAHVEVGQQFIDRVLDELQKACEATRLLAQRRLDIMDDPCAVARRAKAEWQEHLQKIAALKKQGGEESPHQALEVEAPAPKPAASSEKPAEEKKEGEEKGEEGADKGGTKQIGSIRIIRGDGGMYGQDGSQNP
jgi:hypothetical protein